MIELSMRGRAAAFVSLSLGLASCIQIAPDGNMVPPEQPISIRHLSGRYDVFAACAFLRLESGTSVQMTELRAVQTTRIFQQQNTGGIVAVDVRFWDMTIRQIDPTKFEVSVKAPGTIYGPDHYARQIWEKIGPCEAQANLPPPRT